MVLTSQPVQPILHLSNLTNLKALTPLDLSQKAEKQLERVRVDIRYLCLNKLLEASAPAHFPLEASSHCSFQVLKQTEIRSQLFKCVGAEIPRFYGSDKWLLQLAALQ